jgi:AraC-like DNA-binding protein
MLKTIQIIALLQGMFVLYLLYVNRNNYKKTTFSLLFGCLLSVVLFVIGDDEYNLLVKDTDWVFFHSSLFITFLFLFFKYSNSKEQEFSTPDYLFFLPNIIYFIIEGIEMIFVEEIFVVEFIERLNQFTFIIYLSYIIYSVVTTKRKHWVVYFVIPIVLVYALSGFNEVLEALKFQEIDALRERNITAYLLLITAFLFYFITFNLMNSDNLILPKKEMPKYKNSNLKPELIEQYKAAIIDAMTVDKIYLNNKLSIYEVSKQLDIPRQYISEVLNVHMNTNFQDFINHYRVNEFVDRLKNDQNKHFTLLGIATDVGFSSKSSFNATFKKIKGLTPTQYRNNLVGNKK